MKKYQTGNKILSLVLALCMLCGMVPTLGLPAFAAGTVTRTTKLDCSTFTGDASSADEGWSWDYDTKTLTLDGANIVTRDATAVYLPADATVVTKGQSNHIESTYRNFNGTCGIEAAGDLTFNGETDAVLEVIGGESYSGSTYGIWTSGKIVFNSGTLNCSVGDCYSKGHGIGTSGFEMNGGSVTATGSQCGDYANGINSYNGEPVIIRGGSLTVIGGDGYEECHGIWTNMPVTITGGTVVAKSDDPEKAAIFVESDSNSLTIGTSEWPATIKNGSKTASGTPLTWSSGEISGKKLFQLGTDPVTVSFVPTLIFVAGNGEADSMVEVKADMTLPTPTFKDYTLEGWYASKDYTGAALTLEDAKAITAISTPYYAKWTKNGKTVRLTELDCSDFTADASSADEGWSWDYDTNTLTLDGTNIVTSGATAVYLPADATVVAKGQSNRIESTYNNFNVTCGIEAAGDLTFNGEAAAVLDVVGGTTYGESTYGIYSDGKIVVNSGTLNCSVGNSFDSGYGIGTFGFEMNGGIVTATGSPEGADYANGINSSSKDEKSVTIRGGSLTVTGGNGAYECHGIWTNMPVTITGGTVAAKSYDPEKAAIFVESDTNSLTIGTSEWPATITNGSETANGTPLTLSSGEISGKKLFQLGTGYVTVSFGPSIAVAAQSKALTYGTSDTATFAVRQVGFTTPAYAPEIAWVTTAHAGVTVTVSGETVTANITAAAKAGAYKFKVVSGEIASGEVTLTIDKANYVGTVAHTVKVQNDAVRSGTVAVSDLFGGTAPDGAEMTDLCPVETPHVMERVEVSSSNTTECEYTSYNNPVGTDGSDSYTVKIDSTNYNEISGVLTFTAVDKARVSITGITVANRAYNGNPMAPTGTAVCTKIEDNAVVTADCGTLLYTYTGTGSTSYPASSTAPTNAGSYKLVISVAEDNASYAGASAELPFTISQKEITVSGITAADKAYDATTDATMDCSSAVLAGKVGTEELSVTATGAFADKNVGAEKIVSLSGLTLGGADAANYKLAAVGQQTTASASIRALPLTISGASADDKVYDGSKSIEVSGGTLQGVVTGDTVTLNTTNATGEAADALVGTDKAVRVTGYTLGGEDAGNYTLTQPTGLTADITNAALDGVSVAQNGALVYNGQPQTAAVTTSATAVNGQSVHFTYSTERNGTYTDTVPALTRAGSYTIYYKANAANHSEVSDSFTVEIAQKLLAWDVSALNAEKPFDGNRNAVIAGSLQLSGIVAGDDAVLHYTALSGTYALATDGLRTVSASASDVTLTGEDAANYKLPVSAGFAFVGRITPMRELSTPPEATDHRQMKLEVENGISTVPAALAGNTALNTPEKIIEKLTASVNQRQSGIPTGNIVLKDVTLWISDSNGAEWTKASDDNFPADGITIVVPFADLGLTAAQAQNMTFTVSHLFTVGAKAGQFEYPAATVTASGLSFRVTGLSPIAIGFAENAADFTITAIAGKGGSFSTAEKVYARIDESAGFTITPDKGYRIADVTVDGKSVGAVSSYVFTHITSDHVIRATFTPVNGSPKTGDATQPLLWVGLLALALAGVGGTSALSRRRKNK